MEFISSLHPLVIHFPIAFLLLYIILEIINLFLCSVQIKKMSLLILLLGVIGAIFSVITGNQSFQFLQTKLSLNQLHNSMIEQHEYFATLTIWYFFGILTFQIFNFLKRKNEVKKQYLFIIFAAIGLFLLFKTASKGGMLVYEFGIGTDLFK